MSETFPVLFKEIPTFTTIEDWTKKNGYAELMNNISSCASGEHAAIMDESISIGSEKLLAVQAIDAEHCGHALKQEDVKVVALGISKSWTGENVAEKQSCTEDSIGRKFKYNVSDGGRNLVKASFLNGTPHHLDISHTVGNMLKEQFAECEDFVGFTKWMGENRVKLHLTDMAYMQPPKQRTISRFMNCFGWVKWAYSLNNTYDTMTQKEQATFAMVRKNEQLINELHDIMECVEDVLAEAKKSGINKTLARRYADLCVKRLMSPSSTTHRKTMMAAMMGKYFIEEGAKVADGQTHTFCSDSIESMFGIYKERKSPNKNYGITPYVLTIPLYSRLATKEKRKSFDVAANLCMVSLRDVKEWKELNCYENWVSERTKRLKIGA